MKRDVGRFAQESLCQCSRLLASAHVYEVGGQRGSSSTDSEERFSSASSQWTTQLVRFRTFPTTSSRTVQAPFSAHGSPGMRLHRYRADPLAVRGLHRTLWVLSAFPCTPSPCLRHYPERLSTTGALLPCGSRRVGNPIVSRFRRSVFRSPVRWVPRSLRVVGAWCLLPAALNYGETAPSAP
jgi:hypothetical protein